MENYKKTLSDDILKAIENFELVTGVEVFDISFERIDVSTAGYPYDITKICKIDFELK